MEIKEIQQKVGTIWKYLETPLSHYWRSALSEIPTFVCLKLWKPILREATKPKDESVFDTGFEASVGFIRGAVEEGGSKIYLG